MREKLLALAHERTTDEPAHDILHVLRVAKNAEDIAREENAVKENVNVEICVSAALLHELFNYPKGHPDSPRSGEVCAEHARVALEASHATPEFTEAVCYAIAVHPFSLRVTPKTLEAKILQDADRLDAIGAIGIARCFATTAVMRRPFYSTDDPFCDARAPTDFAVDHFYAKLLKVPDGLHTPAARRMAASRMEFMNSFLLSLRQEISR